MKEVENIYKQQEEPAERSTTTEMMISRQAQEVQAAMVIAKKFPRDNVRSFDRIMQSCKRKTLAEQAMYEYPRGDQKVTGPSIRLAEAIAQNWGNIDYGILELEQKNGKSQVMAYAWDLETNTRQCKVFSVPHIRHTKKGDYQLTDPRDIYELVANQGARRVRACILGVIPGDVVDAAIQQCNNTLIGDNKTPVIDLVREMADIFQSEFSVPVDAIEKYIGCKAEVFSMYDLIRLKKVYRVLKDGMGKREDYFDIALKTEEELADPFENQQEEKEDKKVILTDENYYSPEANKEYFSVSMYKDFSKCEAMAMAKLRGEYVPPVTKAMLVGSFVDAWAEGTLDRFIKEHPAVFTRKNELKAEFKRANEIIKMVQNDARFSQFMSGEKQKILTFEMFGTKWKMKMDSYFPGICITDLKVVARFYNLHRFRYDLQGAVYQEGVYRNGLGKLPFYLAAVTKESVADHDIFQITQPTLDMALSEIEINMPRFIEVKEGYEEPNYCGVCDYCKSVKKTRIRDYNELMGDMR